MTTTRLTLAEKIHDYEAGKEQTFTGTEGVIDFASYEGASGLYASLTAGLEGFTPNNQAYNDTYVSIEGLIGTSSSDNLAGNIGANTLRGGAGDDTLYGLGGGDLLNGGGDSDWASYEYATAAVTVTLDQNYSSGVANAGAATGDVLISIEHLIGSAGNDVLIANAGNNSLSGGAGSDTLMGGEGNDYFYGNTKDRSSDNGIDFVSYAFAKSAVEADMQYAVTMQSEAAGDHYSEIEGLIGSNFNDLLGANDHANTLKGGNGDDKLWGYLGADELVGGAGIDWAVYSQVSGAVRVSLVAGAVNTGSEAEGDKLIEIEAVKGSLRDDQLTGNEFSNTLDGSNGNDTLTGGGGADSLVGGEGDDIYFVDNAADVVTDSSGNDTVVATADYVARTSIETIIGNGTAAIKLTGNGASNTIKGNSGANTINGSAGNDKIYAGIGNDRIYGGTGNDTLKGEKGKDVFVFDARATKGNVDRISDFSVKDDTIWLDNKVFAKLGSGTPSKPKKLDKKFFKFADKVQDANDYLIYNKTTGVLSYDKDGWGDGQAVEIAKLARNLKLTDKDFYVI
jgi:Ca2+-binding RTX toxin-like protein